ncbi:MAG: hypothetical protein P1U63_06260 [Coxiellaceae bacterium]|nr:hypothetical protein [Coxiellaceae bacterium]
MTRITRPHIERADRSDMHAHRTKEKTFRVSLASQLQLETKKFKAFNSDKDGFDLGEKLSVDAESMRHFICRLSNLDVAVLNKVLLILVEKDISSLISRLKEDDSPTAAKLSCLQYIAKRILERDKFIFMGHPAMNGMGESHHGIGLFQRECYSARTKLSAAIKLLSNLQAPGEELKFTADEIKAANQGRLKKIVDDFSLPLHSATVARVTELTAVDPTAHRGYGTAL